MAPTGLSPAGGRRGPAARSCGGALPDPEQGWLAPVEAVLRRSLEQHEAVSVEATGAWESDYLIADHLEASGHRVLRVRLTAPEEVTLERLRSRTSRKVPVSEDEARAIYASASVRAADACWDLIIETSGSLDEDAVADAVRQLASLYEDRIGPAAAGHGHSPPGPHPVPDAPPGGGGSSGRPAIHTAFWQVPPTAVTTPLRAIPG
jgi:hypothetical protein